MNFLGYWGIGQDFTEEKQSELEVRQRTEELGQAFDALDVSILILDKEHRINYANDRWKLLHVALDQRAIEIGTPYDSYLRTAIEAGLFPEAETDPEEFLRDRSAKNLMPPNRPFKVSRQNGIVLSLKVTRMKNGFTLIASTDISKNEAIIR